MPLSNTLSRAAINLLCGCVVWLSSAVPLVVPLASAGDEFVKVVVAGDAPKNGIFDPSVEYAPGTGEGWLSYSAVYGDLNPWGPHVETHLARSTDGGATWTFEAVINASTTTTIYVPGEGLVTGVWNYEVSSLVHDPGDAGAEWKLFAHRVFRRAEDDFTGMQNIPAFSWITLRSAPHPSGPWSAEVALLSSGTLPPPPYDSVAVAVNDLDPSLSNLLVYSEPGAFERDGVLYLSLTGLMVSGSDRILLLASDDHGNSWRFVSTLLDNSDAAQLGYLAFDGSAVASDRGRVFLMATPESPAVIHDGTLVFEFDSIEAGTLIRSGGSPRVHLVIPTQPGLPLDRRGGQADFHVGNSAGGLLQPSLRFDALPEAFQFSSTGIRLVDAAEVSVLGTLGHGALVSLLCAVGCFVSRR